MKAPPPRLTRQHFALYRGFLEGATFEGLHDVYGEGGDVRVTRRLVETLRDTLAVAARRARDAEAAHLLRLRPGSIPLAKLHGRDDVPTLDAVVRLLDEGDRAFERLVAAVTPEQLASTWSYQNFQGQTCRVPLWAVYRHVVNHATYHRGQASAKLKRLGVDAPSIDFVFWAIAETPQEDAGAR